MIYIPVSRGREIDGAVKAEAGTPLQLKVSIGEGENQPILGFATIALAEKYLDQSDISREEYRFILKDRGLSEVYNSQPIVLIESESEVDAMVKDAEGYDYARHIFTNA